MNRRSLLSFLGLAPLAAIVPATGDDGYAARIIGRVRSTVSPVTSASYHIACDSGTAIVDRAHLIRFQSGASAPTVPLSTASGCAGLVTTVLDDGAGSLVFSRTSPDTFSVFTGSAATDGATSFTLINGQYATLTQGASGIWEVRVTASGAASGSAGGDLSGTYPNPTVAQVNGAAVPTSALAVGTNSSKQLIAASLQGTDTKVFTAGTVSGTGAALCTDANGGATTSGCSSSSVTFDSTSIGQPQATAHWAFTTASFNMTLTGAVPASSGGGTAATDVFECFGANGGAATNSNTTGGAGAGCQLNTGTGGASTGTAINSNGGNITGTMGQQGTGGSGFGSGGEPGKLHLIWNQAQGVGNQPFGFGSGGTHHGAGFWLDNSTGGAAATASTVNYAPPIAMSWNMYKGGVSTEVLAKILAYNCVISTPSGVVPTVGDVAPCLVFGFSNSATNGASNIVLGNLSIEGNSGGGDTLHAFGAGMGLVSNGEFILVSSNTTGVPNLEGIGANAAGMCIDSNGDLSSTRGKVTGVFCSLFVNGDSATISDGAAVRLSTTPGQVARLLNSDSFPGLGVNMGSCAVGAVCRIGFSGFLRATMLLGASGGTCSLGQWIIKDSTTSGSYNCTSTFSGGNVFGIAMSAVSAPGNPIDVMLGMR